MPARVGLLRLGRSPSTSFGVNKVLPYGILLLALGLRILYAAATPPFQGPDEPHHVAYVEYLSQHHSLPVQPASSTLWIWEQYFQPPLYYLVCLPLFLMARLAGGTGLAPFYLLRGLSVLLGMIALVLVFRAARALVPERADLPLAVLAFAAFLPTFIAVNANITNDVLAAVFGAWSLWLAAEVLHRGPEVRRCLLLALALGLGLLTKLTLAPLVLAAPLAFLAAPRQGGRRWLAMVGTLAGAGVLIAPWLIRNLLIYGSLSGFDAGTHPVPPGMLGVVGTAKYIFLTFWATFGYNNQVMVGRWNWVFAVVTAAGGVGFLLGLRRWWSAHAGSESARQLFWSLAFCGTASALSAAGVYYYGWKYAHGQGRHLYGALAVVAVTLLWGIGEITPPRARPAVYVLLNAFLLAGAVGFFLRYALAS